jgi:hypothetical protein
MEKKNLLTASASVILLALLTLACSSLFQDMTPRQETSAPQPTPAPAATATPDTDSAKLLEKLDELEKKLEEQQKQTPPPQVRATVPPVRTMGRNAWVNSPGDGFLALRSQPNTESGYRILQIPHGNYVHVISCQTYSQRLSGRTGRWCQVSYGGYTGWAFDGWLVY